MPIRINLKEIFPSDPQEINVEKLNFNFNKLLELGVGTPGPIGLTGPQGPAGPIGATGPQGIRGATWWVDSGAPTTHTFTQLLDGDLYLDNVSFDVWQWHESTSTWTNEVGISAIINNYLAASGSPFVKTLGNDPLNQDDRFIVFSARNSTGDIVRGTTNSSLNNALFLHNFDETDSLFNFPSDAGELYNSLLSIMANHSDNQPSVNAENGRYHIELGSLYNNGDPITPGELSGINHNLKIKYYRDFKSSPYLPLTNDWVNIAKFSLSIPEEVLYTDIDENSLFNFITPKWNNESGEFRSELSTYFGPSEAVVEQGVNFEHIVADGITFSLVGDNPQINSTIGIAHNYSSSDPLLNTKNLFMLDTSSDMDGVLINDKVFITGNLYGLASTVLQGGLWVQLGAAIGSTYSSLSISSDGLIVEGYSGFGTPAPDQQVHVVGNIKMEDGNQEDRAVMTSDSDGVGSWSPFSEIGVPTGTIVPYFGITAPAGWYLCNGQSLTRTVYPVVIPPSRLYSHMLANGAVEYPDNPSFPTQYSVDLPDLRDRFIIGADGSYTLGQIDEVGGPVSAPNSVPLCALLYIIKR